MCTSAWSALPAPTPGGRSPARASPGAKALVPLVAAALIGGLGLLANQHLGATMLRSPVAIAAGALAATVVVAWGWIESPARMTQGVLMGGVAAACAASVALI
ncbi:hypothetical protein [Ramlibacter rhizophilus]|uniref:Uncharacterized protein n=1 Tax=Ramlibacter rhizophilus TaxID=1781167 RepID=A0A4Z0C2I6_9BURK|nr:hypothetical protein [Ramlibacter rhizophilus]TFZ04680.1 hypothetical protein EZ242_02725 [Ramlibacter rhizophilus]